MLVSFLSLAWLIAPPVVQAHSGAPYPVLLEQPVGPYVVSALGDPDVGVGTFTMQITLATGAPVPTDTVATLWVRPADGHTAEAGYQAQRQVTRDEERFIAKVLFDAEGMWHVRLVVDGPAGVGRAKPQQGLDSGRLARAAGAGKAETEPQGATRLDPSTARVSPYLTTTTGKSSSLILLSRCAEQQLFEPCR